MAQLGIQKIALIIKAEDTGKWSCISYTGTDGAFISANYDQFVMPYLEVATVSSVNSYDMSEFEFVIPVAHKKNPIGFAFLGDFRAGEELDTKEEKMKFTQTITNIILVANENKRLFKGQMDRAILDKELKLAAAMQNMLVPSTMNNEQIETAAFYKPHKDIGGDYYDFIKLSDDEVVFCISDISGKGVPAALLMANFQANLRAIVARNYGLDTVVDLLNRKVGEITKGEKFITLFIAKYNIKKRVLEYVNAGHNPSILYSKDGTTQLLDKGCTILGMFDMLPFINIGEVSVPEGAILINYTDGLTEAADAKGDLFDIEGLLAYTKDHNAKPLVQFNTNLVDHINAYKGSDDFDDDLTLLTIRFH
jgi:sigma-B regulation protein RsbU (phosphoserine phosphatase)